MTDPTLPVEIGSLTTDDSNDVVVVDDTAYVADGSRLRVIDISNLGAPQELGNFTAPNELVGVVVRDGTAYVTEVDFGVRIIDVSSPETIAQIGSLRGRGTPTNVTVQQPYAYVGYSFGFCVFEISNPAAAVETACISIGSSVFAIEIRGGIAYVGNVFGAAVMAFDVSDPYRPFLLGAFPLPRSVLDLEIVENLVFVATRPEIRVDITPSVLWPPKHRMVRIGAVASASDVCSTPGVILASVTSSERSDSNRAGGFGDDIQDVDVGTLDLDFELRAERAGRGDGRTYTVTYRAEDAAGNSTFASAEVVVPHDHRSARERIGARRPQVGR